MATITFDDALRAVVETARLKLPDALQERLTQAAALVRSGHVWPEEDGVRFQVESRSTPGTWHAVTCAACPCEDAHYQAPEGLCAHRLAVGLWRRSCERRADEQERWTVDVEPEPVPPQAPCAVPAIMSTTLTIAGRQVEVKLCDTDDARLVARLRALLHQFPVPQAAAAVQGEGWCPTHGVPMRWNPGKDGKSGWWSHKTEAGTWCKGRK